MTVDKRGFQYMAPVHSVEVDDDSKYIIATQHRKSTTRYGLGHASDVKRS